MYPWHSCIHWIVSFLTLSITELLQVSEMRNGIHHWRLCLAKSDLYWLYLSVQSCWGGELGLWILTAEGTDLPVWMCYSDVPVSASITPVVRILTITSTWYSWEFSLASKVICDTLLLDFLVNFFLSTWRLLKLKLRGYLRARFRPPQGQADLYIELLAIEVRYQ